MYQGEKSGRRQGHPCLPFVKGFVSAAIPGAFRSSCGIFIRGVLNSLTHI